MARGELLRRRLAAELERTSRDAQGRPLGERLQDHLTESISLHDLDRDVDRAVGSVLRRLLWITTVLAIGLAAWLGFQIVVSG